MQGIGNVKINYMKGGAKMENFEIFEKSEKFEKFEKIENLDGIERLNNVSQTQMSNSALKNLKSTAHSNSNSTSTSNSTRLFQYYNNSNMNTGLGTSKGNSNYSQIKTVRGVNIKNPVYKNNHSMTRNSQSNIKQQSRENSFLDYTSNTCKVAPAGANIYGSIINANTNARSSISPNMKNKTSTFIQNSYSQLSKQLKQNKPNNVRTSFQGSSNYMANPPIQNNNVNNSFLPINPNPNTGNLIKNEENFLPYKKILVKSYEYYDEKKKLNSSSLISDEKSIQNIKEGNEIKTNSTVAKSANCTHRNNTIRLIKNTDTSGVSSEIPLSKDEKASKDNSVLYFRGSIVKDNNVEGPEELHFMHVSLNSKQKLFVYKLEESGYGDMLLDASLDI
jgi:hypothetical protein